MFLVQPIKKHLRNFARILKISTPHGQFSTPVFMPVGTRAAVNLMRPCDLLETQSQIILGGNTYHMLLAPGMEIIQAAGGMHTFMGWQGPMLTDSGGFQVLSLAKDKKLCSLDDTGAHFRHPHTGKTFHLTPESSLSTQKIIGADIIMAFDQCTSDTEDPYLIKQAMDRTHRWLKQSLDYHQKQPDSAQGKPQALFGIIQGGNSKIFRQESAEIVTSLPLDGTAIGGETIGSNRLKTLEILDWLRPWLIETKPRYTMGVGMDPQDLLDIAAQGIDMFDCVAPTRNARHGALYCGQWIEKNGWLEFESEFKNKRLNIRNSLYAKDQNAIMPECTCSTCKQFSRAYLHYLFKHQPALFSHLACIHNIHVMNTTCQRMKDLIYKMN